MCLGLLISIQQPLSTTSYSCWSWYMITTPSVFQHWFHQYFVLVFTKNSLVSCRVFGGFFPPLPFLLLFLLSSPGLWGLGVVIYFFLFLAGYSLSDLYVIWIVPALFCFRNTVSIFQLQLSPCEYALLAGLETAWVVEPREWWWMVLHPVRSWSQVVMRDWLKLLLAQNNWNRRSDICSLIREKIFK